MTKRVVVSLAFAFVAGAFAPARAQTLEGFARLPADTFAPARRPDS